jgi:LuxR family transcriptional regulator, maltose regulon positive regulatory protein
MERQIVARPALFDVLSQGIEQGITLVCGPPGSGKTELLRSWLAECGLLRRTAWISVRKDEQDEQAFWRSVVDQLRVADSEGEISEAVPAPQFHSDQVVERLLIELAALGERLVLVIDDLHELRSSLALERLEALLTGMPTAVGVVLASRRDPKLGLHRLRLAGRLTELREDDLRFTPTDARALLRTAGVELTDDAFAKLYERTEGWAAGLRLAAVLLRHNPFPDRFVAEFSGSERTIADYLFAEVLEGLSDEDRRVLVRTSVLDQVNGPLADLLTGGSNSERVLQNLEQAGTFVTAVDAGRHWFRYHQLFADLLQLELRRTEPSAVPELHRLAAGWHAAAGNVVEAIRHLQAAGEWREAARLLADQHHSLCLDGRSATAHALLRSFPPEAPGAGGDLALVTALDELLQGSPEGAAAHAAIAERLMRDMPEEHRGSAALRLSVVRMAIARRRGDTSSVLEMAGWLDETREPQTAADLRFINDARALALMHLGAAELWSARLDDAERHLLEGLDLSRQIPRPYVTVGSLGELALLETERASGLALAHSKAAIDLADSIGWQTEQIIAPALLAAALTQMWMADVQGAEIWLARAERALISHADPAVTLLLSHVRALSYAAQQLPLEAARVFAAARRVRQRLANEMEVAFRNAVLEAKVLARQGKTGEARAVLDAVTPGRRGRAEYLTAVAAVQLADGARHDALGTLALVLEGRASPLHPIIRIDGYLIGASAKARPADDGTAHALVEHALAVAEPIGAVLPFLWFATPELLRSHPRHQTAHASFLDQVLDVLSGSSPVRAVDGQDADELSAGEFRVLGYLASNLTAPEIADELYLTTNTVKTHLRHIYAELHAHSRSTAVARARELGLLAPSGRPRNR